MALKEVKHRFHIPLKRPVQGYVFFDAESEKHKIKMIPFPLFSEIDKNCKNGLF